MPTHPEGQGQHAGQSPVGQTGPMEPADPFAGLSRQQIMAVQQAMNAYGQHLAVDGIVGPATRAAYSAVFPGEPTAARRIAAGEQVQSTAPNAPPPGAPPPAAPVAPAPPPASATSAAPAPAGPAAAPGDIEQQLREQYGYLSWAYNDGQVHAALVDAITNHRDPAWLRTQLEQTDLFRRTAQSARDWMQVKAEDPATAEARIQAQIASITRSASVAGIAIDAGRARDMAEQSLASGWTPDQLQSAILAEFHYTKGQTAGRAAQIEQQLRGLAGDYELPLDDGTIGTWVEQAVKQQQDPESYRHFFVDQAKGMYKGIASELDKGLTVRQASAVYRNIAATELGLAPDTINWQDPKWGRALNYQDPKSGEFRAMDQYQWQTLLRSDAVYGWSKTAHGRETTDNFALQFLRATGSAA
jgi:hypothetical protein